MTDTSTLWVPVSGPQAIDPSQIALTDLSNVTPEAVATLLETIPGTLAGAIAVSTEAAPVADGSASADAVVVSGGVTKRASISAFMLGLFDSTSAAAATESLGTADVGLTTVTTQRIGATPASTAAGSYPKPFLSRRSRRLLSDFVSPTLYAQIAARTLTTACASSSGGDSLAAAVADIGPYGGTIFVEEGQWVTAGGVVVTTSGVEIEGDGYLASEIKTTSATADILQVGNQPTTLEGGYIGDIGFNSSGPRTAGVAIHVLGIQKFDIERVRGANQFILIRSDGGSVLVNIRNVMNYNPTAATVSPGGCLFHHEGGNDIYLQDCFQQGVSSAQPTAAYRVRSSGACYLQNCGGLWSGTPFLVDPASGQVVENLVLRGKCTADTSSGDGLGVVPASGGQVNRIELVDFWTATLGGAGRRYGPAGGGTILSIRELGGFSLQNGMEGMSVGPGVQSGMFTNLSCLGNSVNSPGAYNQADIAAGVSNFQIIGGRFGAAEGFGTPGKYGISVGSGSSSGYEIIGADCRNNSTGGLYDGGTGAKFISMGGAFG